MPYFPSLRSTPPFSFICLFLLFCVSHHDLRTKISQMHTLFSALITTANVQYIVIYNLYVVTIWIINPALLNVGVSTPK